MFQITVSPPALPVLFRGLVVAAACVPVPNHTILCPQRHVTCVIPHLTASSGHAVLGRLALLTWVFPLRSRTFYSRSPSHLGAELLFLCARVAAEKNVKSAELLSQEMPGRFGQHRSASWHVCALVARARFEFPRIAFASLMSCLQEMRETFISAGMGSSSSPLPSVTRTDPSQSRKLGLSDLTSGS